MADALAASKPFVLVFATPKFCASRAVRPDARPDQADRRGAPGRHVHQRRAVQARGRRRPAPAGADRNDALTPSRRPTTRARRGAVGLRRRRRRRSSGLLHAHLQRHGARVGHRRAGLTGRPATGARPPATARPAPTIVAVPDPHGLRGRLVLGEMPGRELRAVLESPTGRTSASPAGLSEREAADSPSPPNRRHDHADDPDRAGWRRCARPVGGSRQDRPAAVTR